MIKGNMKAKLPRVGYIWVDVRDIAFIHIRAIEIPDAAGKRIFITTGYYNNTEIEDIKEQFPEYRSNLPGSYEK